MRIEKDPYFLQISKSNTEVCLIIQNCKHGCEPEIVQKKSKQKTTQESKQKQFHIHNHFCNFYKTRKSRLSCIGNSEENIDLSRIYLAVSLFDLCQNEKLSDIKPPFIVDLQNRKKSATDSISGFSKTR